jgi:Fic family protein
MADHPQFKITPRLLSLLTAITELKAWIVSSTVDVPWLMALQRDTAARLAHSSTAIEGNPLSLGQVQGLSRGDKVQAEERSRHEVLNYFKALAWIEKESAGARFTEKKLFSLHRMITQGLMSQDQIGRYKSKQNLVVDGQGKAVYIPPKPAECARLTRELAAWMNQSHQADLHPLIVGAVAHHRMLSIHPFADGNGRVSRALGIWVLFTRRFDTRHLFAWDEYFEADRSQYYQKIQQARELDDDLTYWLEYTAQGLQSALEKTRDRITALQIKKKGFRFTVTAQQEQVLRFIREHGKVKSADIGNAFKCTRSRVNQVVKPLVDADILKREGETRATTYRVA